MYKSMIQCQYSALRSLESTDSVEMFFWKFRTYSVFAKAVKAAKAKIAKNPEYCLNFQKNIPTEFAGIAPANNTNYAENRNFSMIFLNMTQLSFVTIKSA
jgi:hypothetical protein